MTVARGRRIWVARSSPSVGEAGALSAVEWGVPPSRTRRVRFHEGAKLRDFIPLHRQGAVECTSAAADFWFHYDAPKAAGESVSGSPSKQRLKTGGAEMLVVGESLGQPVAAHDEEREMIDHARPAGAIRGITLPSFLPVVVCRRKHPLFVVEYAVPAESASGNRQFISQGATPLRGDRRGCPILTGVYDVLGMGIAGKTINPEQSGDVESFPSAENSSPKPCHQTGDGLRDGDANAAVCCEEPRAH